MIHRLEFVSILDQPWLMLEPIRLGGVPTGLGTPDRFLIVELSGSPRLRLDLYRSSSETYLSEEARLWSGFVVVGWGERVYLVAPSSRAVAEVHLGSYFGAFHEGQDFLLVASAERLLRISADGKVVWQSEQLGIDGVVVEATSGGEIVGQGEFDPPGGWKPFRISSATGVSVLE